MGIIEAGKYIEVHPTFLYESIATFIIFMLLITRKRKFAGEICYLYIILYSFERMLVEGLRIDSLMVGDLRISQVLSVVLFVVFEILYLKRRIATKFNLQKP